MSQEKAATPVLSVRDAVRTALYDDLHPSPGIVMKASAERQSWLALEALGIDPDMPVETIRRQLLVGERVETYWVDEGRELHADPVVGHLVCGEGGVMYMAEALLRQLTRPDNTDSAS